MGVCILVYYIYIANKFQRGVGNAPPPKMEKGGMNTAAPLLFSSLPPSDKLFEAFKRRDVNPVQGTFCTQGSGSVDIFISESSTLRAKFSFSLRKYV